MYQISEKILLTIWVGGMWSIGYVVVPVLFKMLDKSMAGNVAAQLFTIMSYIGILAATVLIINILANSGFNSRHWQLWTIIFMLLIIIIGQFVIQPMMAELKAAGIQESNAAQFAKLHGTASVLFLINSLAGLVLVITGLKMQTAGM